KPWWASAEAENPARTAAAIVDRRKACEIRITIIPLVARLSKPTGRARRMRAIRTPETRSSAKPRGPSPARTTSLERPPLAVSGLSARRVCDQAGACRRLRAERAGRTARRRPIERRVAGPRGGFDGLRPACLLAAL